MKYMKCVLPFYLPFIRAVRKQKVKDCNWSRSILEISSSRKGTKIWYVLYGIWQFYNKTLSSATILASVLSSLAIIATYFLTLTLTISISRRKISIPHQRSLIMYALRSVKTIAMRQDDTIPANPFLQQARNTLSDFFKNLSVQQQLLKQTQNWLPYSLDCEVLTSNFVLNCEDLLAFLIIGIVDCACCII